MSSHAQAKGTTRAVAVARASTGLTTHRPAGSRVRAWCQGSRDPSAGRDREARARAAYVIPLSRAGLGALQLKSAPYTVSLWC